jgi:hypothetical protein
MAKIPSLQDLVKLGEQALVPSTYYRSQHPELFSDSEESACLDLPRDLFAFSLERLTTDKKEREFEDFARRLAEREVCPNLLPQTGPTGGGDSKTDASTYPVADELAGRCWWGHTAPANEDWAFAFSCKHDWRAKVKDDIAKIAGLPREFSKAFFITNQPVKDKSRAEVENDLRSKHGIDVRIFDRNWLIERVYANHHEALAIDALGLQFGKAPERRMGANDFRRSQKLESLVSDLRSGGTPGAGNYVLAQDYLAAAKLSSSLQRPRDETDGLFVRARELAIKSAHLGAFIRTHYTHAWRTFFWYDDVAATERILEIILPRVTELQDAELLELVANLCSILETANFANFYPQDPEILNQRRKIVFDQLRSLVADTRRPNNALHAETLVVCENNPAIRTDPKAMEVTFRKLAKIFRRAHGLNSYPIFHFMEVWEKMGEVYCDWPGYRDLQKTMQDITAKRFGETESGRRQLEFGYQLLAKGRSAEALSELSSARFLLGKEETLGGSVEAALGCAGAYQDMGNLWAARSEIVLAAHISLGSLESFHEHPRRGYYIAKRMCWIELQLGRLTPFLAWRNLATGLLRNAESIGEKIESDHEDIQLQDVGLACLLLKAAIDDVRLLRKLADTFEGMGLFLSHLCLLWICGEDQLVKEELEENPNGVVTIEQLLEGLRQQPIFGQMPHVLSNDGKATSSLSVRILDTLSFEIRCENQLGPHLVSESILGMLDAAFARAKLENFAIVYDEFVLELREADGLACPPDLRPLMENIGDSWEQVWGTHFASWLPSHRHDFEEYLSALLRVIIFSVTIDPFDDLKAELKSWAKEEVFNRALLSAQGGIALLDVIGHHAYDLQNWTSEINESTAS